MNLISTYISTVHNINLQLSDFISYFLKILGSATWAYDAMLWIIDIALGIVLIFANFTKVTTALWHIKKLFMLKAHTNLEEKILKNDNLIFSGTK